MGMSVGGGGDTVKSEPNVVPMIDVMLVLLIIFMLVTPVISAGFQATMPQARNITDDREEPENIVLGIDRDGNYYLDPGTGSTSPVRPADLETALTSLYQNRTTDRILYFKADNGLSYAVIEDAMIIARKAGVRVLAAITEPRREGLFGAGVRGN
ncbi:MAG: biopolymer transporter ExbD [Gemmatimonadales bacterium]